MSSSLIGRTKYLGRNPNRIIVTDEGSDLLLFSAFPSIAFAEKIDYDKSVLSRTAAGCAIA